MPPTTCRPYGLWDSPIEAAKIFAKSTSLSEFYVDAATSHFYHVESRPAEGGRSVLVETLTGRELVGSKSNVRDRCHEYGGGSADVRRGWAVWSEFESNLVFRRPTEGVHEAEQVVPSACPGAHCIISCALTIRFCSLSSISLRRLFDPPSPPAPHRRHPRRSHAASSRRRRQHARPHRRQASARPRLALRSRLLCRTSMVGRNVGRWLVLD